LGRAKNSQHFKRAFFTGLAALLPTVLTIAILIAAVGFIYTYISVPAGNGFAWIYNRVAQDDNEIPTRQEVAQYTDKEDRQFWVLVWFIVDATGFVLAVVAICFLGLFLAGRLAGRLWRRIEQFLGSIPVFKAVFPYVKQFTDFVFRERQLDFKSVVAVEYPRKGLYSVGLLTGSGLKALHEAAGEEIVSVFIPSTPWPATGFLIFVPKRDIVFLPITVDKALALAITGGVAIPPGQVVPGALDAARAASPLPPEATGETSPAPKSP